MNDPIDSADRNHPAEKKHAAGRQTAHMLTISRAQRQMVLCRASKTADCASKKERHAAWVFLKRRLKQLKHSKRGGVRATKAFCLNVCKDSPIAVVFPDGTWHGGCHPHVPEEIIREHLIGGRIVERHVLAQAPMCAGHPGAASCLRPILPATKSWERDDHGS